MSALPIGGNGLALKAAAQSLLHRFPNMAAQEILKPESELIVLDKTE
jgi:hypothetical protein